MSRVIPAPVTALAAALSLAAGTTLAQGGAPQIAPMTVAGCESGWDAVMTRYQPIEEERTTPRFTVTSQGFCRISSGTEGVGDVKFQSLEWRAEGIEAAVETGMPPTAMDIRVFGVNLPDVTSDIGLPPWDLRFGYRHDPATKRFEISELAIDAAGLDLRMAATVGGVDLGSQAAFQLAMGSLRLRHLTADVVLDGGDDATGSVLTAWIGAELLEEIGVALAQTDTARIPLASREALTEFFAALPEAAGTLTLDLTSEPGIGLLQISGAINHLQAMGMPGAPSDLGADALGMLLSGAVLTAAWQPAG